MFSDKHVNDAASAKNGFHDDAARSVIGYLADSRGSSAQRIRLVDRQRLREQTFEQLGRSTVVVHVTAPAPLEGTRLHRELKHALAMGVPIFLLHAPDQRRSLMIQESRGERLEILQHLTNGTVIDHLSDLAAQAAPHAKAALAASGE